MTPTHQQLFKIFNSAFRILVAPRRGPHSAFVGLALILCGVVAHVAAPSPPPASRQAFVAAKDTSDVRTLLAVFQRVGQDDSKDAALAILYAGLSEEILVGLSDQHLTHVLVAARQTLSRMTAKRARKAIYKAVRKHPNWRVRAMLLDIAIIRAASEKWAQKAIVRAITDSTDAVAIKAIETAGALKLKRAVPALMRLVIGKWG